MARCIPDKALNNSPETVRLFNLLKRSLDDKYILRQRIPSEDWAPVFWIEHDSGRHLFLVVSPVKTVKLPNWPPAASRISLVRLKQPHSLVPVSSNTLIASMPGYKRISQVLCQLA